MEGGLNQMIKPHSLNFSSLKQGKKSMSRELILMFSSGSIPKAAAPLNLHNNNS